MDDRTTKVVSQPKDVVLQEDTTEVLHDPSAVSDVTGDSRRKSRSRSLSCSNGSLPVLRYGGDLLPETTHVSHGTLLATDVDPRDPRDLLSVSNENHRKPIKQEQLTSTIVQGSSSTSTGDRHDLTVQTSSEETIGKMNPATDDVDLGNLMPGYRTACNIGSSDNMAVPDDHVVSQTTSVTSAEEGSEYIGYYFLEKKPRSQMETSQAVSYGPYWWNPMLQQHCYQAEPSNYTSNRLMPIAELHNMHLQMFEDTIGVNGRGSRVYTQTQRKTKKTKGGWGKRKRTTTLGDDTTYLPQAVHNNDLEQARTARPNNTVRF